MLLHSPHNNGAAIRKICLRAIRLRWISLRFRIRSSVLVACGWMVGLEKWNEMVRNQAVVVGE